MKKKDKPITIREIAAKANVSIGSVDKVLHNNGHVDRQTEERIKQAITELGYKPVKPLHSIQQAKSYTFAVLIPEVNPETQFWSKHLEGVEKAYNEIHQFGIDVQVFYYSANDKTSFQNGCAEILSSTFDGVLMAPVFPDEAVLFVDKLNALDIPCVFFDTDHPQIDKLGFVGQDSFASGYVVGELLHFCTMPDAHFLVVTIAGKHDNHAHFANRKQGFQQYFEDHLHTGQHKIIFAESDITSLDKSLDQIFKTQEHIGGIFVINSRVYKIAEYLDKNKKHTIRLVGYDLTERNIEYLQKGIIHFLINQQPEEQGYHGILNLFYDRVLKRKVLKTEFLPVDIISKTNLKYANRGGLDRM